MAQGYRATPNVAARPVGDALFLCLPDDQDIVHLNPTGAAIWHLLSDPDAAPESGHSIAALMAETFPDIPRDAIAADVAAVLSDLAAAGLIRAATV
jgi:hypothetical protein